MSLIQVTYGRHVDVSRFFDCLRCEGKGTRYLGGNCEACNGTGTCDKPNRGYTYRTSERLSIGDIVEVPGNWYRPGSCEATVLALSSDYNDSSNPPVSILRVIERKET